MNYPHTIDNGHGEILTFLRRGSDGNKEFIEIENTISPNSGPPMHLHHLQDEQLTVIEGRMGIHTDGDEPKFLNAGETILFQKGVMHRFWNAGTSVLRCKGKVWPPDNIEYFLTSMYASIREGKNGRPGMFDAAYLTHRYRTEFKMKLPLLVQNVIFPLTLMFGYWSGKQKKFKGAPEPINR